MRRLLEPLLQRQCPWACMGMREIVRSVMLEHPVQELASGLETINTQREVTLRSLQIIFRSLVRGKWWFSGCVTFPKRTVGGPGNRKP